MKQAFIPIDGMYLKCVKQYEPLVVDSAYTLAFDGINHYITLCDERIIVISDEALNTYFEPLVELEYTPPTQNKYNRTIVGKESKSCIVDVYDVLKAFEVTNPALQHLIKKALCVGIRGHKDSSTDLQDIIDSAIRAKELHNES